MNPSAPFDLQQRTKQFAFRIIKLYLALPKSDMARFLGNQMVRSGTSVGAHFAEAAHSKSAADFISKCQGARQEMNETLYWISMIADSELVKEQRLRPLIMEAKEILAILVAMTNKARHRS